MVALLMSACGTSLADENHKGHSDDLLLLLQYKISVTKLQQQFDSLKPPQQTQNLNAQMAALSQAMPLLSQYVAIPEGHYPNVQMYHQSLQTRSAMLQDYNQLMQRYFQSIPPASLP